MSATVDHIDRHAFQWESWARIVKDRAPDLAAMLGVDGIGSAS